MARRFHIFVFALLQVLTVAATNDFVYLTDDELKIDTVLPYYATTIEIGKNYADSVYSVEIEYPEFVPMTKVEKQQFLKLWDADDRIYVGDMPKVESYVSVERKFGKLNIGFVPIVYRDGEYKKLNSFKLKINVRQATVGNKKFATRKTTDSRYADNSVLSSGKWVKIRVPQTGYYQLTAADLKDVGFNDIEKVKVYGYGGALQPEVLTGDYLKQTDDLSEVPTVTSNGKKVFFAQGPVTWSSKDAQRVFNPYSSYGYYFLTEGDNPATVTQDEMKSLYYPADADYHSLYEKDEFAWYHGGRNLFENKKLTSSKTDYIIQTPGHCATGTVSVCVSAATSSSVQISFNDEVTRTMTISSPATYSGANKNLITFDVDNIKATNTVSLTNRSSCDMRLDYICINYDQPAPMADIAQTLPSPEYVAYLDNQNLHADSCVHMVIIVPENGKMDAVAYRLKDYHETKDSMNVKIIHDYELYHEFSSGTPDANAYRRYLKMLYDKAGDNMNGMPRYLLLLGDCAWDNRMVSNDWKTENPKDYLLCYESENSFSETECYMMEDYFGLLDDGEGGSHTKSDKSDIGIGRICAVTSEDANNQVSKILDYMANKNAGDWQNTICIIGDDGNGNSHVTQAEQLAQQTAKNFPGYNIKRVYMEAYNRESSSTGATYPDVTKLLREQMKKGALMMNYTGHGSAYQLSHERVLLLSDFKDNRTDNLPLWFTASCDIMPIDTKIENFGEIAMSNAKGGAVAFVGTTRTVFSDMNSKINMLFSKYALTEDITVGEALRKAKNELTRTAQDLTVNKLHYVLLGDPAMYLACPKQKVIIDSINGKPADSSKHEMSAGSVVTLIGHVDGYIQNDKNKFDGLVSVCVKDSEDKIECHNYDTGDTSDRFVYYDRKNILYEGADSVRNGRFEVKFSVPMDIKYDTSDNAEGLITAYACRNDKSVLAHGEYSHINFNNVTKHPNDSIGPSIYCYLNSPSFVNGGKVNPTPYFVAELNDKDGINASGSSIGHDITLVIDGKAEYSYNLNDYFEYTFGSYTSGSVKFSIPELTEGQHKLRFRAWDILNNSSTTELVFNVVNGLEPSIVDISCTCNPAKISTDFLLVHDRVGSAIDVTFEVYDMLGRIVWRKTETNVVCDGVYPMKWDLTSNAGSAVGTGVYLYRARISGNGSSEALKAKKLIVVRQ